MRLEHAGDDLRVFDYAPMKERGLRPRLLRPPAPLVRASPSQFGKPEPVPRGGVAQPNIPPFHRDTLWAPALRGDSFAPERESERRPRTSRRPTTRCRSRP